MKPAAIALSALALHLPGAAFAQSADHAGHHPAGAKSAAPAGTLSDGEVRKVGGAYTVIQLEVVK